MNELQKIISQNAMILKVAPEMIKFTAMFSDLTEALGLAFEGVVEAFSGEKTELDLGSKMSGEMRDFFIEVTDDIYDQVPAILENCTDVLEKIEADGGMLKAQQLVGELKVEQPSLPALDKAIDNIGLMTCIGLLESDSPASIKIKSLIDCFTPLFDELDAQQRKEIELETAIFTASETGDLDSLAEYIDAGLDLNAENNERETGLMVAVKHQQVEAVKYLLEQGSDPAFCSFFGDSAFYHAVLKNDAPMFELLLSHAGDSLADMDWDRIITNALNNETMAMAPLVLKQLDGIPVDLARNALDEDKPDLMKMLLENGLDANLEIYSDSLLKRALDDDKYAMAEVLISAGADLNKFDFFGNSALYKAIDDENSERIAFLEKHGAKIFSRTVYDLFDIFEKFAALKKVSLSSIFDASISDNDERYSSLFHIAIQRGATELVKHIIDKSVDVNILYKDNSNLIRDVDDIECLTMLLDAGLDINHKDERGESVIESLINERYADKLQLLVERGVELNVQTGYGPLLHYAATHYPEFVKTMLSHGANPDIKSENGYTYIQEKIHWPDQTKDLIIAFANAGADFRLPSSEGFPIVHVLAAMYDSETVKTLIEMCGLDIHTVTDNGHDTFMQATYTSNHDVLKLLAKMGADVNRETVIHVTPLNLAISRGELDLVKTLVEDCKVDTEKKFINLYTPLSLAKHLDKKEIVRYLS